MWSELITFTILATIITGEERPPGIKRTVSDGVRSVDVKLVYGDEDMSVINEVINDFEKQNGLKKSINLNDAIKPLPAQDVKCIMSVDRYCSKEMSDIKKVMIQAIKEDCGTCSTQDKEKAGKVIASLMTHDPVAWKQFLTRSALLLKNQEGHRKAKELILENIGEPEEVIRSRNSYIMSGSKVRVKRYISKVVEEEEEED